MKMNNYKKKKIQIWLLLSTPVLAAPKNIAITNELTKKKS